MSDDSSCSFDSRTAVCVTAAAGADDEEEDDEVEEDDDNLVFEVEFVAAVLLVAAFAVAVLVVVDVDVVVVGVVVVVFGGVAAVTFVDAPTFFRISLKIFVRFPSIIIGSD